MKALSAAVAMTLAVLGPARADSCGRFGTTDISDIFERASPSVVAITVTAPSGQAALGAGFVWDGAGHIVTNDHVVAQGNRVVVTLASGEQRSVDQVARAPERDLAVLRVVGSLPAPVVRGQPPLRIGQWVVAIGNPYGLGGSVSVGVVSGLGRSIAGANGTPMTGMIQTDALLNPGNSGGGLFDCGGQLIGVTTAVSPPGPGPGGVGFAIAIDQAGDTVRQLVSKLDKGGGQVMASMAPASATTARIGIGLSVVESQGRGLVVQQVAPSGPAAVAGSRPGDLITHIDGSPVRSTAELTGAIQRAGLGNGVSLKVVRGTTTAVLQVTVSRL